MAASPNTKSRSMTPVGRVSFPKLFVPGQNEAGEDVYEVTLIITPENFTPWKAEAEALLNEAIARKWGNNPPKFIAWPIRFGEMISAANPYGFDLDKYPEYKGNYVIPFRSNKIQPGVVDAQCRKIIETKEVYPGCYGRATVTAYAFQNPRKTGVSFGLQNFQKVKDGEVIGGNRVQAEAEFAAIPLPEGTNGDLLGLGFDDLGV